jgi:LasA protease
LARRSLFFAIVVLALVTISCTRIAPGGDSWRVSPRTDQGAHSAGDAEQAGLNATARPAGAPVLTPTPDPPRVLPTPRQSAEQYTIRPNDTLGQIAQRYGVSLAKLIETNSIANPDLVEVGQVLIIPPSDALPPGPSYKIIPDSELVYGPGTADFDIEAFVKEQNGYLYRYQQEVDGRTYDGAGVVARIAKEYSVNPRLLLALLEYRSGWVTQAKPDEESLEYPMLNLDTRRKGLYRQLAWTANNINRGYYTWRAGGVSSWILQDGSVIPVSNTINAGTAGVQYFYSLIYGKAAWEKAVTEQGLFAIYTQFFGYPFDYAFEPLLPGGLVQPPMQLPFEKGDLWSFTGGPHGGWGEGSGWAAIDFAPPGPALGCVQKDAWVVAVADGLILRADIGAVVQDLDGDGLEQTGWTVLYMHIESRNRVQPGTYVRAGERIGHASCEGGVSTGTHLHLARRYNGEWIPADGPLPFNLDGWISKGTGSEYNGIMTKNGVVIEAWEGRREENQISR